MDAPFILGLKRRRRRSPKTSARRVPRELERLNSLSRRLREHDPRDPRREVLDAVQHARPIEVPAMTLTPSPDFLVSLWDVFQPDDVRLLAARCLGETYQPGHPLRSFCPLHPSLDERALTLVGYWNGHCNVPLVHCRRCGFALPLLTFVIRVGMRKGFATEMVLNIWPEQIRRQIITDPELQAARQHVLRLDLLDNGRAAYALGVSAFGLAATFGDWAALTDAQLQTLLARVSLPPELRQDVYLLNILRNWRGEIVAVDVHAQADYRPLFRHWLVVGHDEPLFAVPHWGAFCDPDAKREFVRDAADGHALELEAAQQPVGSRRSVWLRCEPQPVLAAYAPFEEMR